MDAKLHIKTHESHTAFMLTLKNSCLVRTRFCVWKHIIKVNACRRLKEGVD